MVKDLIQTEPIMRVFRSAHLGNTSRPWISTYHALIKLEVSTRYCYNTLMNTAMGINNTGMKRAAAHYAWSVAALSIYGGQVCPYIEGLGIPYWAAVLGVTFALALAARPWFVRRYVINTPHMNMVRNQFVLEMLLFMSVAVAITLFNLVAYEFPVESGMKILVGVFTLGFFASADLALERERFISEHFARTGQYIEPRDKHLPLTAKFLILAVTSVTLLTAVIFLVISKDLEWLSSLSQMDQGKARLAVFGELAFITVVILAGIFNLIASYSRNLRIFFANENLSLKAVAAGDFSSQVTVSTNDEFGVMAWYTNRMINDLRSKIDEIKKTQEATIHALASLAEIRDMETGLHIIRTKLYVKALAGHLSTHPDFSEMLDPDTIELLHKSAPLHDIGKVGIPDSVLLKPARLTPEEFEVMKQHPVLGGDSLKEAEEVLGESSFLSLAREIAYTHHEKWDGSGYPKGLIGDDIPLSGRLMALADVYDALVFKRVYKPAIPHAETRGIIIEDRGRHFDPRLVDAFLEIEDQFIDIASQYQEETA